MKKFLQHIIFFFVFTAVLYLTGLFLCGHFLPADFRKNLKYLVGGPGYTYTRLHEVQNYKNVDVLFLGSSHSGRGFDPRIFKEAGYSSFNLATNAQTPLQAEMLMNRYIDSLNPKTVVFEVYPYTFSSDGVESAVDILANDKIDKHAAYMALWLKNLKTYNTLLYGYLQKLFSIETKITEKSSFKLKYKNFTDSISYVPGGFNYINRQWASPSLKEQLDKAHMLFEKGVMANVSIVQDADGKWSPRSNQLASFERILKTLAERKIRVVLVQAPIDSRFYKMIRCNKEIDVYFSCKGDYYNFNDLIHFDNTNDFTDYDHLSEVGVRKMNEAIIKKLSQHVK
ncbi:MAG: hypothetical protein V4685_01155 [Bacteroidota bacterium]